MGNATTSMQRFKEMTTIKQSLQVAWLGYANLLIDLTEVK
jgi:hypothetical protein